MWWLQCAAGLNSRAHCSLILHVVSGRPLAPSDLVPFIRTFRNSFSRHNDTNELNLICATCGMWWMNKFEALLYGRFILNALKILSLKPREKSASKYIQLFARWDTFRQRLSPFFRRFWVDRLSRVKLYLSLSCRLPEKLSTHVFRIMETAEFPSSWLSTMKTSPNRLLILAAWHDFRASSMSREKLFWRSFTRRLAWSFVRHMFDDMRRRKAAI